MLKCPGAWLFYNQVEVLLRAVCNILFNHGLLVCWLVIAFFWVINN